MERRGEILFGCLTLGCIAGIGYLERHGWFGAPWLVAALAGAGTVSLMALVVAINLPPKLKLNPHAEIPEVIERRVSELEALGFRRIEPAYRSAMPVAVIVGMVHETGTAYATVFQTGPRNYAYYDFVSILRQNRGSLTSSVHATGAALPPGVGEFRQVLSKATAEQLWAHHQQGIAFLDNAGLPTRDVSDNTFVEDLTRSIARQRTVFMRSPFSRAIRTVWRTILRRPPCRKPLADQRNVTKLIDNLRIPKELPDGYRGTRSPKPKSRNRSGKK